MPFKLRYVKLSEVVKLRYVKCSLFLQFLTLRYVTLSYVTLSYVNVSEVAKLRERKTMSLSSGSSALSIDNSLLSGIFS